MSYCKITSESQPPIGSSCLRLPPNERPNIATPQLDKAKTQTQTGKNQCDQGEEERSSTGSIGAPQVLMPKSIVPQLDLGPPRNPLKELWALPLFPDRLLWQAKSVVQTCACILLLPVVLRILSPEATSSTSCHHINPILRAR